MSLSRNANAEQVKIFLDSAKETGNCYAVFNRGSHFYRIMKESKMNLKLLYSDQFTEFEKEELLNSKKMKINTLAIDEMLYTSTGLFIYSIDDDVYFGKNERDILLELTRIFDTLCKISDVKWDQK
jgi:hypothetical protein